MSISRSWIDLLERDVMDEDVEDRLLDLVGIDALAHRQVALRVEVDAEDVVARLGERDREVQRRRRLRDAALLVRERDHLGAPGRPAVSVDPAAARVIAAVGSHRLLGCDPDLLGVVLDQVRVTGGRARRAHRLRLAHDRRLRLVRGGLASGSLTGLGATLSGLSPGSLTGPEPAPSRRARSRRCSRPTLGTPARPAPTSRTWPAYFPPAARRRPARAAPARGRCRWRERNQVLRVCGRSGLRG